MPCGLPHPGYDGLQVLQEHSSEGADGGKLHLKHISFYNTKICPYIFHLISPDSIFGLAPIGSGSCGHSNTGCATLAYYQYICFSMINNVLLTLSFMLTAIKVTNNLLYSLMNYLPYNHGIITHTIRPQRRLGT